MLNVLKLEAKALLVEIELVEMLLAVIRPLLRVLLTESVPLAKTKLLLNETIPVTPRVLLITVAPAYNVATYALFVEIELVEMLLAVSKLVLIVPLTLKPPESVSEPTVRVAM